MSVRMWPAFSVEAVAGACNILTPKVVVAGHFLPAGELFVQPLREAISRHTLIRFDESEWVLRQSC
ncbi:hypothetical protein MPLB_1680154 [Mesorhizobium sp. ORS 3324]|nr:hypothetical protein MPLB_1680154 [Mesorhizobium sp. ORS 3324]